MLAFINGKKTYIVAVAAALFALVQYWAGNLDADGLIDAELAAAGLAGLRHGVSKIGG